MRYTHIHGLSGVTLRRPGNAEEAEDDWLAQVMLSVRGGAAGQIVLPISELPDVHGDVAVAPRDVPAVSGTGVCATGGSDMAMVVLSLDSYDSIRTTDHPFELPPLDGASVTHPEDVSALLDMTDTVLTRGIPRLPSLFVAVGRPGGTLPTSAFGSDSPDFLDTDDLALYLPVPELRCCFLIMDFASDIDPGLIFR